MEQPLIGCVPYDFPGDGRWMSMHTRFKHEAESCPNCDLLLIGDSIVHQLQFTKFYNDNLPKGKQVANFGIGGDKVENILWRVQDGDWLNILKPKVIVLFVGTNNVHSTPLEIVNTLDILIQKIYEKTSQSHIILPLLLPRGQYPNKLRQKNYSTNDLIIHKFSHKSLLSIVDMEKDVKIIDVNGVISHNILHDYLHLTEEGYAITWKNVFIECEKIMNNLSCNTANLIE